MLQNKLSLRNAVHTFAEGTQRLSAVEKQSLCFVYVCHFFPSTDIPVT